MQGILFVALLCIGLIYGATDLRNAGKITQSAVVADVDWTINTPVFTACSGSACTNIMPENLLFFSGLSDLGSWCIFGIIDLF
jgi:hypothetical protein